MTPLIEAAQAGNELAFERLLSRHQRLLDAQASRFYLPSGDADVAQEARIGSMNALQYYRSGGGSSFQTFAELCISRQLATAVTAARRAKHEPLDEGGSRRPGRTHAVRRARHTNAVDEVVAHDHRPRSDGRTVQRARTQDTRPRPRGLVERGSRAAARGAAPEHRQCAAAGEAKAPRMAGGLGGMSSRGRRAPANT
jgi:DNA-directed RNA polymerase specialized sigma24 family protein